MSERQDLSEGGYSIRQDQPDNPFLRAASPEVLDANYHRWFKHCTDIIKNTRPVASLKRRESEDDRVDAQRVSEAREVIDQIPLTHVVSGPTLSRIAQDGTIKSMAMLEQEGVSVGAGNTLDIDRKYGLHDFVFLRLSNQSFRIFGIEDAVKLVFDRSLLLQQGVFGSLEDIAEHHVREQYMGLASAWDAYLSENFAGNIFPEIAAQCIAASYADPKDYLRNDRPDFHVRSTGQEEFLLHIPYLPPFEVKIYQQLPLHFVREMRMNRTGERGEELARELDLDIPLIHDETMVPW